MSRHIITLLSDLGTRDASVAIAKAMVMAGVPGAQLVDVSHHIPRAGLMQAAYVLGAAWKHFPAGTIHIALVDVFAGADPRMLLVEKDGAFFILPDNGLPGLLLAEAGDMRLVKAFSRPYVFREWLQAAGAAAGAITNGNVSQFPPAGGSMPVRARQPGLLPDSIDCSILGIDRFENVILDLTRAQWDALVGPKAFRIRMMRMPDITEVSANYNDVSRNAGLCRFNTAGFLEIAVNHGRAADSLGLETGDNGSLPYHTIRIFIDK